MRASRAETMTNLWQHIRELEGKNLETLDQRRPFRIVSTTNSRVIVRPGRDGEERAISRSTIESAWQRLARKGELSYEDISSRFSERNAPYIAAILGTLPNVSYRRRPISLHHRP